MSQPSRKAASAQDQQRKPDAETYLHVRLGKLYPDVDWAAGLREARRVLALVLSCSTNAEDEFVYKQSLIQVLECLNSRFEALPGCSVSCSRSHANLCKAGLDVTLASLSSFYADLALSLAGEGFVMETAFGADSITWQIASGEVETYVHTVDSLLGRIAGLQEKLQWRPGYTTAPHAPPILFIAKLHMLQNKLHVAPKLSTCLDIGEILSWLRYCENHHADHCSQSVQSRQTFRHRPKWLIDVQQLCLVPAETHYKYIALSYVWGPRGAAFKTKKRNLHRIQQPGSLHYKHLPGSSLLAYPVRDTKSDADIWRLPSTIRNAMTFTAQLGEQFLWVDALCIVQDDEDEQREHLLNMGSIYANSTFTLVAAEGTAFSGLRGLAEGYPFTRVRRPADYIRYPTSLHREIRAHHRRLQASKWNQRGWTFQEQIFSRRLLVFSKNGVSWECHCTVWFEGMPLVPAECRATTDTVAQGFSASATPNLNDYARHVEPYNRRELTYPEDAVDGISGVLGVFGTVFDGGFVAGLPVMFFDQALLWTNPAPLQRRKARLEIGWNKVAPTWSWAAWMGSVEFIACDRGATGLKSLVQWSYATGMGTKWGPLQAINKTSKDEVCDVPLPPFTNHSPSHLLHCYAHTVSFKALRCCDSIELILSTGPGFGDEVGMLTACEALPAGEQDGAEEVGEARSHHEMTCEVLAISEMVVDGEEAYHVLLIERELDGDFEITRRKGVGWVKREVFEERKGRKVEVVLV